MATRQQPDIHDARRRKWSGKDILRRNDRSRGLKPTALSDAGMEEIGREFGA